MWVWNSWMLMLFVSVASSCSHHDHINIEDSSWVTSNMNTIKLFTILGFGSVSEAFLFNPSPKNYFSNLHQLSSVPKNSIVQKMSTKATQEWDVDRYQNQHSFVWQYGSSLIDLLDPQPGERILDAGCGSGELTNSIAERGATGIGFDFDPSMVKRAQEQFPKLTFFQADASNFQVLEEEGGPVDAIFSNAALHWVRDADGAAASMSKALKPGGRFVVEFGGKGNVQRIVEATLETMNRSMTTDSPWYFPSVGEYSSILEKHGIEVTSAALYDRPTVLEEGDEGLSNWLRMFGGAFFRDMSDEQVNNALTTVNHKLRPHLWDGTQWTADYRRIRIIGKKL